MEQSKEILNEVSDETGQFDPRFVLWRKFCVDQGIPIESLPGDLTGAKGRVGTTQGRHARPDEQIVSTTERRTPGEILL